MDLRSMGLEAQLSVHITILPFSGLWCLPSSIPDISGPLPSGVPCLSLKDSKALTAVWLKELCLFPVAPGTYILISQGHQDFG